MSLRTQYVDAGLKNVSLSNFHGVAVRNATIYGKYFPTHTGSKPPPPKRARSRSASLHPLPYRYSKKGLWEGVAKPKSRMTVISVMHHDCHDET